MRSTDPFGLYYAIFLLYGCVVDVFAADFIRGIAREGYIVTYGKYRLHQQFRRFLGTSTAAFMDKHSLFFPLLEIVAAVFLAACAQKYGLLSMKMSECIVASTIMLIATIIDLELFIYPTALTSLLVGMGIFFSVLDGALNGWPNLTYHLKGGLFGFGVVYLERQLGTWVFRKEAMGLGDLHMCAGIGLFLGWDISIVFCCLWPFTGLAYALFKMVKYRVNQIPTGPAYLPVFLFCLLYTEQIRQYVLASLIKFFSR